MVRLDEAAAMALELPEGFRTRLAEATADLVLEGEGDGDETRVRARLASGVVSLLIDIAHTIAGSKQVQTSRSTTSAIAAVK